MRLRTTYKGFTEAVDLYFDHLMSRVVPLQVQVNEAFFGLGLSSCRSWIILGEFSDQGSSSVFEHRNRLFPTA